MKSKSGIFHLALLLFLIGGFALTACGDATGTPVLKNSTESTASSAQPLQTTASPTKVTNTSGGTSASASTPSGTPLSSAVAGSTTGKAGGTLRVGLSTELVKLDPAFSSGFIERQVLYNVFDSLVAIDSSLKIIPALAESWEISSDGKIYTFHLRKGVKFHDGTDFDADAVKFNINRYQTIEGSVRKSDLEPVESVESIDQYTSKFTLKTQTAPLLATLVDRAGMMLSPTAVKKLGTDLSRNLSGAGTGPFQFIEWKKDDHLTLDRNSSYWQKDEKGNALPYLAKIIYRPITDDTARITNLKTGDVDVIDTVPGKDVEDLKSNSEINYKYTPSLGYYGLRLNVMQEPLNNKALRQALAYSIDREKIFKTVYFGVGALAYGPLPPSSWAFDPNFKPFERDLAKAKAKLAEGGKPNGYTFKVQTLAGSSTLQQLTELIRDQVSEVGITMEIEQLETSKIAENENKKTFMADTEIWSGRVDPDGNVYAHFKTGGSFNFSGYSNQKVDELLNKARTVTGQDERKQIYQEIQQIVMDDMSFLIFYFTPASQATRKNVQNFQLMPDAILRFNRVSLS